MSIGIIGQNDIVYEFDGLYELVHAEKGFTFPDNTTTQSLGIDRDGVISKIKEFDGYEELLLKWINGGIGNSIMELSGKTVDEIGVYFGEEFADILSDMKNMIFDKMYEDKEAEIDEMNMYDREVNSSEDILDSYSRAISYYRRLIEEITGNPVALKINAVDPGDVRHSGTRYKRTIHLPVGIDIDSSRDVMALLTELRDAIECTGIFIVDPDGNMYGNMGDIGPKSINMGIARQQSQRGNQKELTISRTSLPYYADGDDTKSFSPGHNKGMVASLIRVPMNISGKRFDIKLFYKDPIEFKNKEVETVLEYAKVIEEKLPSGLTNLESLKKTK